jgi:hypothetical protein
MSLSGKLGRSAPSAEELEHLEKLPISPLLRKRPERVEAIITPQDMTAHEKLVAEADAGIALQNEEIEMVRGRGK